MKKRVIFLPVMLLLLTLCGCGRQPDATVPTTAVTTAAPVTTVPSTEPEPTVQATEPVIYVPAPAVDPDMTTREAFQFALQQLSFEHLFPDGTEAPFVADYGFIEDNKFAIFDADSDGREELLMAFTTTYAAAGQIRIYGYDPESGSLHLELLDVPYLTVYTGGLIRVDASHNHTYAGDTLWPHQLYRWDPETDVYEPAVYVDAWERAFGETHVDGTPYPDELDPDHTGAVYLLYTPTWGEKREMLSKGDFDRWQLDFLDGAQPMAVPYQNLTEQNIAAVTEF